MLESINFKILCEDTTFHAENIDVSQKKMQVPYLLQPDSIIRNKKGGI